MKKFYLIILAFLASHIAGSQPFNKAKMDSLFSVIEANEKGMGNISIFRDGEDVYQHSFGFADIGKQIPATENTRYRIGSISKTFTATIIMQLVEEGKLSLETTVDNYFPELPNADKITIEHLLRHRSGLYNFTSDKAYQTWMENPKTRKEMLNLFVKNGSVFSPGEKYQYSNTNYVLLSFIAEKVTGEPFPELLKSGITEPLGLQNTYYGGNIDTEQNEALSYKRSSDWELETETDMSIPSGAGAVVSTPTDLNVFLIHLFTGNLVSDSSLARMKTIVEGYGMGLVQLPFDDKKAFGHGGGIDGFRSMTRYFPEEDVSIAYISNGVLIPINDIIIGALSIYFGKDYELPDFAPAIELEEADLDPYVGVYSGSSFPTITISREGNQLIGQTPGQPPISLEAYKKNKFRFERFGLKLEFVPSEEKMIIRQGTGVYELKKEEE